MSDPDFGRMKRLFLAASELPAAERGAFLDAQHGLDAAMRAGIDGQLAQLEETASDLFPVLRAPEVGAGGGMDEADSIDRYKLLQRLGEGGFGAVWMAEQLEPVRRKVAVKVIKLGMDTRQVVARFEAERQALALMDHPNIARVFDGGVTSSGRPYFAMELVRGIPITDYCDRAGLGVRERLELFRNVCHAVQHAHQKGVIHRDLKPGNVLVTLHDGEPVAKVIDFGIAKATSAELTQQTLFTELHQLVGTPEYMAPEQAELSALDVDTRSDIYSLGALLYELLTGAPPFRRADLMERGYAEMMRVIREDDPPRPSTCVTTQSGRERGVAPQADSRQVSRWLQRDLDWIVMKALEKQRTRRYETASALSADVLRYLRDEPVLASPPTRGYRVRKFVARHRLRVVAGAVMFGSIAAAAVFSVAYAIETAAERDKARAAQESLTSLVQVMRHADPFLSDDPRVDPSAALDAAAELVGTAFPDRPRAELDVRVALGAAYWRQGELRAASGQMALAYDLLGRIPDTTAAERRFVLLPGMMMYGSRDEPDSHQDLIGRLLEAQIELLADGDVAMERRARELVSWSKRWRFPLDEARARQHWEALKAGVAEVPPGDPRWLALGDLAVQLNSVGNASGNWAASIDWLRRAEALYVEKALMPRTHMMIASLRETRMQGMARAGDLAGAREIAEETLDLLAPALPESHWYLGLLRGWRALARVEEDPHDWAAMRQLRDSVDALDAQLGVRHFTTTALLTGLVRAAVAVGAPDAASLRDRLAARLGDSTAVPDLGSLELVLEDGQLLEELGRLRELWTVGSWSVGFREDVRSTVSGIIGRCARLDPARRMAVARWLFHWHGQHFRIARNSAIGNAIWGDVQELNEFVLEASEELNPEIHADAHQGLGIVYGSALSDPERALRHARASVSPADGVASVSGKIGWRRAQLGLRLLDLGHPTEGFEEVRAGYTALLSTTLHIDVFLDFAHRHLMRAYVEAGVARGDLRSALREGAGVAVEHLRGLMRGGATADSLNQASWAVVRSADRSDGDYELALRATQEGLVQYEEILTPPLAERCNLLNTMCLAEVRTQRWSDAAVRAQRLIEQRREAGLAEEPLDHLFLAMASQGLGQAEPALSALRRARSLLASQEVPPSAVTGRLLRETERVLRVR